VVLEESRNEGTAASGGVLWSLSPCRGLRGPWIHEARCEDIPDIAEGPGAGTQPSADIGESTWEAARSGNTLRYPWQEVRRPASAPHPPQNPPTHAQGPIGFGPNSYLPTMGRDQLEAFFLRASSLQE